MTFEEFKEFLEKNHIDIDISLNRYLGILTCKFYIDDNHILETYEVKSGFDSICGANHDKLIDTYISLLAKKVKLKDVRDVLVSALAGDSEPDDYEICEVESSKKEDNSAGPIITGSIKMPSIREETLDAAKKCVMGDREQDYGTPESNFATIASFWSDYLDTDISACGNELLNKTQKKSSLL